MTKPLSKKGYNSGQNFESDLKIERPVFNNATLLLALNEIGESLQELLIENPK